MQFWRNYKTTAIGFSLAVLLAVQPVISTGEIDWKQLIVAIMVGYYWHAIACLLGLSLFVGLRNRIAVLVGSVGYISLFIEYQNLLLKTQVRQP